MGKKCLIAYSSITGHTEKVALKFKETFEKQGWKWENVAVVSERVLDLSPLGATFNSTALTLQISNN